MLGIFSIIIRQLSYIGQSLLVFAKTPVAFNVFLGCAVFMISLLGTRLTIIALRKRATLLDYPNLRSNHKTPTPRGGGIAVVMALIIGLLIADVSYSIVIALFLLAAVSLLDDLIGIPPLIRLLVQFMAVSMSLAALHLSPWGGILPPWLDKCATILLWIWIINLFNFMDGIDGLAASEMIGIGIGFCLLSAFAGIDFPQALFAYSLIVAAAGCGFLWWNWHPAKIFLGDVGSVPIGFLIGYLLLLAAASGYAAAALILPAYYISDGTITLAKRMYQGKKIWVAHSEHYYQQAVRRGRRHDTVARYIFGVNILLIFLATLSVINPHNAIICLAAAYLAVFMLLGFFAHAPAHPHHEIP